MPYRAGIPRAVVLLAACVAAFFLSREILAKERLGKTFKNSTEGYSLRVPAEWEQIPLQPGEDTVTAKFNGSSNFGYTPELEIYRWELELETPRPDKQPTGPGEGQEPGEEPGDKEKEEKTVRVVRFGPQNFTQWLEFMQQRLSASFGKCEILRDATVSAKDKTKGRFLELDATPVFFSIGTFRYGGTEFAVVYSCHERDWKGAQSVFSSSIRSFQREEVVEEAAASADEQGINNFGGTEEQLQRRIEARKGLPAGWNAFDSENYVYLYNADRALVRRLAQHIEGIRKQLYEKIFPPEKPITAISVVRICKDRDTYMAYGGPGGSAGYWNSGDEELVFYEDENNIRDSFAVLYHEAFHQYIFYSVGDIAPHIWFNEGHGDYFAGAKYRGGRFVIGPFQWRLGIFKNMQATGRVVPLDKFIRMTQAEYYARASECYAQGWAFVYFLREEAPRSDWKRILPTYFDTLKSAVANVASGKRPDGTEGIRKGMRSAGATEDGWRRRHLRGWEFLESSLVAFGPQQDPPGQPPQEPPQEPGDEPQEPEEPPVEVPKMKEGKTPKAALDYALEVAFDGIDLEQLEKAFLRAM